MRVAIDIDGVLADAREYINKYLVDKKDWKSYFLYTSLFPRIGPIVYLVRSLAHDHKLYIVTGRPEANRKDTEWWLRAYVFPGMGSCLDYTLLMRPDGDPRSGTEIKLEWFKDIKPNLVIDDSPETVDATKSMGLVTLQVIGFRATPSDMVPEHYLAEEDYN